MSSEVHIMQTKHFISPSVTVFRVILIGHKNSENTRIEKNGFLVQILYQILYQRYINLKLILANGLKAEIK
jgi:hypothetical protein